MKYRCPVKPCMVYIYCQNFVMNVTIQHFKSFFQKHFHIVTFFKKMYSMTHLYMQKFQGSNPRPPILKVFCETLIANFKAGHS